MRELCNISCEAQRNTIKVIKSLKYEYEIQSEFEKNWVMLGGEDNAYPPICGAGKNASILHYFANQSELQDNDLILCDMAAMKNGLCSDFTTTFPKSGKFSVLQKDVYDLVLETQ